MAARASAFMQRAYADSLASMSGHLTPEQLERLRGLLLEQRARVFERGGLEITEDDDAEPMDLQDQAAGEVGRRDRLAQTDADRRRLSEVQAALSRMADGTYGECEESGDPIPFARLLAEPTTRYTVEAQELLEAEASREKAVRRDPNDTGY